MNNLFKLILVTSFYLSSALQAEEIGIKVDKLKPESGEDTTISISKGQKNLKKRFVITDGSDEITGDTAVVKKDAEKSWKLACDNWKSEFKSLNKDNQIISMSCGRMSCNKEGVESTCQSLAKYKLKVVAEE